MILNYGDIPVTFRDNSSDPYVLQEVIVNRIYRRKKIGFDVEQGEHWLDLGANIGAFAVYCKLRGATAVCYEPDPDCYALLKQNVPEFERHRMAVTASKALALPFWKGKKSNNHSKATAVESPGLPKHPSGMLPNFWAGYLLNQHYDGVKMDIEGSEGDLIDQWLLPKCNKLCMEYHSSRDKSIVNLKRRLEKLKEKFEIVIYPPEYDRIIAAGSNENYEGSQLTYFDRMVYAMGAK